MHVNMLSCLTYNRVRWRCGRRCSWPSSPWAYTTRTHTIVWIYWIYLQTRTDVKSMHTRGLINE